MIEVYPALGDEAQGLRINAVLDFEHPRGERLFAVAFDHGDRLLNDDRARVRFRNDEGDGGAMPLAAGCKRAAMGMETLELRQQRGVDVQQKPAPARDEPGREKP